MLTATTVPAGNGAGSLQVVAVSPFLAAGWPSNMTVGLPLMIVPWLVGGTWNGPPAGMCGGWFIAMLPTTAAGWPLMRTVWLHWLVIVPTNGIGVGVGTGPPGDGIMMMCVSVAVTVSPIFAAG